MQELEKQLYASLMGIMPCLAGIVFIALFFVRAGYGIFRSRAWGWSISNKTGWVLMETPAFIVMLYFWWSSSVRFEIPELIFFLLFEIHYFLVFRIVNEIVFSHISIKIECYHSK